jgi:hypothetical protein
VEHLMMMLLWNTLIDSIRIPYKLKHNFDKLYFIIDSAKCHTTPKLLNHLENNNIKAVIVPPRFTIGVLNYVMNLAQFIIKSYLAN